jgi:hypothetical protein
MEKAFKVSSIELHQAQLQPARIEDGMALLSSPPSQHAESEGCFALHINTAVIAYVVWL